MKFKKILLFIYLFILCFIFFGVFQFKTSARPAEDDNICCGTEGKVINWGNYFESYTNHYSNVDKYLTGVKSNYNLELFQDVVHDYSRDVQYIITNEVYTFNNTDNIINVIPETCFNCKGVHIAIGCEYGFFVDTRSYNSDFNKSQVLIFKTEIGKLTEDETEKAIVSSVKIVFCTEYLYSLTGNSYSETKNERGITLKGLKRGYIIPYKTYKANGIFTEFYETLKPISILNFGVQVEIKNLEPLSSNKGTTLSKMEMLYNDKLVSSLPPISTNKLKAELYLREYSGVLTSSTFRQDNIDFFKNVAYFNIDSNVRIGTLANLYLNMMFRDENTQVEYKASTSFKKLIYDIKNVLDVSTSVSKFPAYSQKIDYNKENFMKVKVHKSGYYTLQTLGIYHTYLALYDNSFNRMATDSGSGENGINSKITYYLNSNEVYYLSVRENYLNISGTTKIAILGQHNTLALNTQKTVTLNGSINQVYEFTPTITKKYSIQTYGNFDTYMYLLDMKGNILTKDDDGGSGTNSKIIYTLEKGKKYYICVRAYISSVTGTSTLKIVKG